MNKFIILTRSPECDTVLINLDAVKCIEPHGDGAFVVFSALRRGYSGMPVVESVREIIKQIEKVSEVE